MEYRKKEVAYYSLKATIQKEEIRLTRQLIMIKRHLLEAKQNQI